MFKFKALRSKIESKLAKMEKKGFTLVEMLAVVALIGILFVVFIPRLDFANDKIREAGVQSDFRSYQLALEQVSRAGAGFSGYTDDQTGKEKLAAAINSYLDLELQVKWDNASSKFVPADGADGTDPWGTAYNLIYDHAGGTCYIVSAGSDKALTADPGTGTTLLDDTKKLIAGTNNMTDAEAYDNYVLAVGYDDGVTIQTAGFASNIDRGPSAD